MKQHPNDVLVEDGWHIVRNERKYDAVYGGIHSSIWFTVFHDHKGLVGLCAAARKGMYYDGSWTWRCNKCQKDAPDVVQGYMHMIDWSMSHD